VKIIFLETRLKCDNIRIS